MTRPIFTDLFTFKPNRHTLGGTAYLLLAGSGNGLLHNWLVDCPAWNDENREFIEQSGGLGGVFLTHRGALGEVDAFCRHFKTFALVQEQEAYLVRARGVETRSFQVDSELAPGLFALWTPGHSPGSSCLLWEAHGGVLFSGRHLLPDAQGRANPVRVAKTFHWPRQLASVERLQHHCYGYICPGAAVGLLRGERCITVER